MLFLRLDGGLGVALALLISSLILGGHEASAGVPGRVVKEIWKDDSAINDTYIEQLRQEAWDMFDHGYTNYMRHAFPRDNLLPLSCGGKDWQGGLAITLVDSLDALMLLDRRADVEQAIELVRTRLTFDKDIKVHVFETVIRVLGGLLSGHALLEANPDMLRRKGGAHVPYDGIFLRRAVELADRLLPAFDTPSGLPALFVNLRQGPVPDAYNSTCTACAGTLLLEFGMLSEFTGNPEYLARAHHAARSLYERRSRLGLVGASLNVVSSDWASKESTIGPGSDSYYEYLLKAYLMFGSPEYLDMFAELYANTMRWMQIPGTFKGYSFLVDVHMDNGRLARPFVSSLGAFWPGMQALAGQERDAADLHANFTAAWREFGWLPEMFGIDLSKVHPEDPGYNLRPEHIESTYMLHCLTQDPHYLRVARNIQSTLAAHNRVACGFSGVSHVDTGAHGDLMESYFLSETVKYLYLMFSRAPGLVDHYVLSTEGHLLPPLARGRGGGRGQRGQNGSAESGGGGGEGARGRPTEEETAAQGGRGGGADTAPTAPSLAAARLAAAVAAVRPDGLLTAADVAAAVQAAAAQAAAALAAVGGEGAQAAASGSEDQGAGEEGEAGDVEEEAEAPFPGELPLPRPVPEACARVCSPPSPAEQAASEARLRSAFPLLAFRPAHAELLRHRRCCACAAVTARLAQRPPPEQAVRERMMKLPRGGIDEQAQGGDGAPNNVLSQVVCTLKMHRDGSAACNNVRPVTQHDAQHGVPYNALVLQLSAVQPEGEGGQGTQAAPPGTQEPQAGQPTPDEPSQCQSSAPSHPQPQSKSQSPDLDPGSAGADRDGGSGEYGLVLVRGGRHGGVSLALDAMGALFGPLLPYMTPRCMQHLLAAPGRAGTEAGPGGGEGHLASPPDPGMAAAAGASAAALEGAAGWHWGAAECPAAGVGVGPRHGQCTWEGEGEGAGADGVCGAPEAMEDASAAGEYAVRVGRVELGEADEEGDGEAAAGGAGGREAGVAPSESDGSGRGARLVAAAHGAGAEEGGAATEEAVATAEGGGEDGAHAAGEQPAAPPSWAEDSHLQGPCASVPAITGPLALSEPLDACDRSAVAAHSAHVAGHVVVVARGGCSFTQKVVALQAAGALGVIVLDLSPGGGEAITMADDGSGRVVLIPALLLPRTAAARLQAALASSGPGPLIATLAQLPLALMRPGHPGLAPPAGQRGGGGAGMCSASPSARAPAPPASSISSRVDLLVPPGSQPFLNANFLSRGVALQAVFEQLLADGRAVAALRQGAARGAAAREAAGAAKGQQGGP